MLCEECDRRAGYEKYDHFGRCERCDAKSISLVKLLVTNLFIVLLSLGFCELLRREESRLVVQRTLLRGFGIFVKVDPRAVICLDIAIGLLQILAVPTQLFSYLPAELLSLIRATVSPGYLNF